MAINDNNLILILEQIQELSNLGENELAESLKTFINKELLPGHLSADTDFDIALWNWIKFFQFGNIKLSWSINQKFLSQTVILWKKEYYEI